MDFLRREPVFVATVLTVVALLASVFGGIEPEATAALVSAVAAVAGFTARANVTPEGRVLLQIDEEEFGSFLTDEQLAELKRRAKGLANPGK